MQWGANYKFALEIQQETYPLPTMEQALGRVFGLLLNPTSLKRLISPLPSEWIPTQEWVKGC